MNQIKTKTILGAGWATLDGVVGQGLAFLVFLIMARLLTPEDFGLVALANLYVLVAQFLIFIGFGQALVQFDDLDDRDLDTAFWLQALVGTIFCGLTLLAPAAIAGFLGNERLVPLISALAPIFILSGISSVQIAYLTRHMDFRALALRNFVGFAIGAIVGIFSALHHAGAWSLVWQQLAGNVVQVSVLWTLSAWRPGFTFSRERARRLVAFGSHAMISDLAGLISRRSDQFFVGKYLGPLASGYYAIAARVSNLMTEVMIRSLSRVTLSSFSRLQGEPARFSSAFARVVEMQSLIVLPAAVGLALLAPEVVTCFFGAKWLPSVPAMEVLLLGVIFDALNAVHQSALTSRGYPGWSNFITSLHLFANLAAFASVVQWGIQAVAIASVTRAVILYPVELIILHRLLDLSPWQELQRLFLLAGVTAGMAAVVYVVKVAGSSLPPGTMIALGSVVGAAFFIGALFLSHRPLFAEIWGSLQILRRRPAGKQPAL